eukprot:9316812-Karenia_brevis.AAC.1
MAHAGNHCLELHGETLVLRLPKRKNKVGGSVLTRKCWCKCSRSTCPVHRLGPLLANLPHGARVFPRIHAGKATLVLRQMLGMLE